MKQFVEIEIKIGTMHVSLPAKVRRLGAL